jgi:hypothetical protein
MRCQWVTDPGNGFAINQHIGGAGKHRRGREALVVGAQVSEKYNGLTHVASFA